MVVDEGYRVFLCNTRTGKVSGGPLPPADLGWDIKLNGAGKVTASFRPNAKELAKFDIRSLTTPVHQALGVAYNGEILECGPIWFREYDSKSELLSIEAEGIWSIFDRRKAVPGSSLMTGNAITTATLSVLDKSLGSIARELVRVSIQDNPYSASYGSLNIVLPASVAGTHDRHYRGYDLGWIGNRLRELTEVEGGPDIRFRPRFKGSDPTFVEWVMEHGSEEQPLLQQVGADWTWDGSTPKSGVVGFSTKEDATGIGAKAWVPGSGQERAMRLASATNLKLVQGGMPWLEVDEAAKEVEDQSVLQAKANRLQADAAFPWSTFSISVRADTDPKLGLYQPGDWASVVIPKGHPTLDPGKVRVRIMAISGSASNNVKLTVAAIQDTVASNYGKARTVTVGEPEVVLPWTSQPVGVTWDEVEPGIPWTEMEGTP